jgi:hypothetical protein
VLKHEWAEAEMAKTVRHKISLAQALARVAARTSSPVPEYEKAHFVDQFRLQAGVARVLKQAADARLESFPATLPLWPPAALIERLQRCPKPRPRGAASLFSLARKLDRKWRGIDQEHEQALQKIAKRAAEGSISIFGRLNLHSASPLVQLDPLSLEIGGFDLAQAERNRLAPDLSSGSTDCFDADGFHAIARMYFDVKLFAHEIAKLFDSMDRQKNSPIIERLRTWYLADYIPENVARGEKPNRDHAIEQARLHFSEEELPAKLRALFRDFRRDESPDDWKKSGRRKQ